MPTSYRPKRVNTVLHLMPLDEETLSKADLYQKEVEVRLTAEVPEVVPFDLVGLVFSQSPNGRWEGVHPASLYDRITPNVRLVAIHPWRFHDPRCAAHAVHAIWRSGVLGFIPDLFGMYIPRHDIGWEIARLALLGPHWRSKGAPQWF